MKHQSKSFIFGKDEPAISVDPGVKRQLLGYDDSILMARAIFEADAIGYKHKHPHSQVAYVESGVFDFSVGDETRRLQPGDCAYIPPNVEHGARCIEAGVLLDIFSPAREDFLS
jgi:quercetin dioxygenase-like cupin family protein